MDWPLVAALIVIVVVVAVLLVRMATFVRPGWKYELRLRGKVLRVLDKPGFYAVSPFVSVKRVRTDEPGSLRRTDPKEG